MSVRADIVLIVVAVCLGTVAFLALLASAMRTAGFALLRAEGAGSQLAALHELDGATGRYDPGTKIVDVYIRYLRAKIDRPGEASLIQTVRSVGYMLTAGASDDPS